MGGEVCVFSRRSPTKETANEDSAAVICVDPLSALFLVADGCGGMAGGERASRIAVETLVSAVDASLELGSLRSAVLDGIEAANREVQAMGTGAATTLAAVEFREQTIRPYHIGDSTVLLVGNRGKIKLQTRSHAPVAYGVEAGLIHEDEAIHHEDLHLVSNVVGSNDTHIEIGSERQMSQRDTLLIASDGLFDNLYIEEIIDIIRKGPLRKAAKALVEKACQRMVSPKADEPSKPDDITFVLFRPKK
jgi:serine/threonine protein phosphatase PrpC